MTQINWTYDGTNVLSGNTVGYWYQLGGWVLAAHTVTQGFFSGQFRGQTTATFYNSGFCGAVGKPPTYTYHYYNRMYGQANGTATRTESTATYNDCVPLHLDVWAAYGQWN